MAVSQSQIRPLLPYLEGEQPTHLNQTDGTREWNCICPLPEHGGDAKRSASLNIDKGVYYCFVCGGMPITALLRRKLEWIPPGLAMNGKAANLNGQPGSKPQRILTEGMIGGWHSALMSNASALEWLRKRRGLTNETIERYQIGWDLSNSVYTIPIRSDDNEIWNVRYYNPNPAAERRKIWSEQGYGSPPRLYPIRVLNEEPNYCLIVGGEWDALITLQNGFPCVTRTAGEDYWDNAWGEWFSGMERVYLAQDMDDKGQKGNTIIAKALYRVVPVFIVKYPYDIVKKHGKDVSDFLTEHRREDLQRLLDEAEPYRRGTKPKPKREVVTVLDTFDAQRVGEHVDVIVTIKGRKEPGYSVPKTVNLTCTRDAGNKCSVCPLNAAGGAAKFEIAAEDPMVLAMINASQEEVSKVVAETYGVPSGRCIKLDQDVTDYQAVEILFARPALDYSDGSQAGDYANIKITSVGQHDTASNSTIRATGALYPNPRSHGNEFLAHSLETVATSIDQFELNADTVKLMKRFQPTGKQKPLRKLAEISHAFSEHVTHIQGRPEMHALMDLTFHSVLGFSFAGETLNRGWLESLIVGDTGTGKSTASQRLVRHFGAGEVISCEAATFAGIVGGLQQMGGKDWAVTWGIVPNNDRRAVVLDEISGLTTEEIASMSDVRSSGQAKLIKVRQEVVWARTRLLWMGNPRSATMSNYTYGVDAIRPLIGNAEDIARFDLAMAVTKHDVPSEEINQRYEHGELQYTDEACNTLLMWVWSRTAENIKFEREAEKVVFDLANDLGRDYIEEPPLILAASVRVKIARLAAALAARTFSTDKSYENVIVTAQHVRDAVTFLNILYGMPTFGYLERSREELADRAEAQRNRGKVRNYLKGRPLLVKHLRNAGKFRRQDLEEIMAITREEANGIINTLYEARMVRRHLGDIYVEPVLHELLRSLKI